MLCEQCRKREATVKYVEVAGGVKTEHNLCAQCAGKLDLGQYSALFEGEFPWESCFRDFLGSRMQPRMRAGLQAWSALSAAPPMRTL